MGNTASTTELQEANEEVAQTLDGTPEQGAATATKLYKFLRAGTGGGWELISSHAVARFYDAAADSGNDPEWWLEVEAGEVDCKADEALQYVADRPARRVTFAANGGLWALRFPSPQAHAAFMEQLEDCVFYNAYGLDNDDAGRAKILGADFKDMFFNANAAVGDGAAPMEEDQGAAEQPAPGERVQERQATAKEGSPIHGLVMGATDNSYLMRGGAFDVMRNVQGGVEDTGITFQITPLKAPGARRGTRTPAPSLTPSRVILAQQERRMNLLSPLDSSAVYHADVEVGKVVSEWRFQKDQVEIPQIDIATDSKAAQLEDTSTFLGLDANRLCKWDMRDPHGVVQDSSVVAYQGGKDYARGTNFSCMATSGDGYVVVGSRDGKLRLYSSKTLAQAKTQIPGLGRPVTAVDVTYDGRWVLATTDDYLLVVKTTFTDDSGKELTSFTSRGGGKLALPRLLRLKPEDAQLAGGRPLRHGKFTWVTEQGRQERWIVASIGNYSVVWNFRRVKSASTTSTSFGGLPTSMDYHMTRKEEEVVDSNFVHDRFTPVSGGRPRDSLVVATPHKVFSLASD